MLFIVFFIFFLFFFFYFFFFFLGDTLLIKGQLSLNCTSRANTHECWTNYWRRQLFIAMDNTNIYVCIFAFSKENVIKSNKTLNYIFEEHRGIKWTSNLKIENGHADRITFHWDQRNIPKQNFPNIIRNLAHASWMRTYPRRGCFLYLIIIVFVIMGLSAVLSRWKRKI